MAGHAIVVLKSFGKFFGLAGVRLGFAIGEPQELDRLAAWLGPWSVSGPALAIGNQALSDDAWIGKARTDIQARSANLASLLDRHGFDIVTNCGLFLTVRHARAHTIATALGEHAILVRTFEHTRDWLRIGLVTPDDLVRLARALEDIMRPQAS